MEESRKESELEYIKTQEIAQKRLELILENPNANFYELFSSTNSATTSATESIESGE